jgi:hypothetical protein
LLDDYLEEVEDYGSRSCDGKFVMYINSYKFVGFEVFTAVVLKSIFFWVPLNALHSVISQKKILFSYKFVNTSVILI